MENIPTYVNVIFVITTFLSIYLFYKAANNSKPVLYIVLGWMVFQAILVNIGFYEDTESLPPRPLFVLLPTVLLMVGMFLNKKGLKFIDNMNQPAMTMLHIVRIPVEIVLFWLFVAGTIPELMTFEGRNFDIIAGITAPFVYYFGYQKTKINRTGKLIWNILCLVLLFNIVIHAILALPTPLQRLAFDQPNIAILYLPYVWLASIIVPLVMFSHFATIRQLLKK